MKRHPICADCGKEVDGNWVNYWDMERTANSYFTSSNNHPKLVEATRLIKEAQRLENEVSEERDVHRKTLKAKYDHVIKVHTAKHSTWQGDLPEGTEYIVIMSHLTNKQDYEDHMHKYGSLMNAPKENTSSVKYYRVHGLLLYEGGGQLIIKDKVLCSDAEWAELVSGTIPEKFKR